MSLQNQPNKLNSWGYFKYKKIVSCVKLGEDDETLFCIYVASILMDLILMESLKTKQHMTILSG